MSNTTLHLTGHFEPVQQLTYVHLPFEVPPGAGRIDVNLAYSEPISSMPGLTGGNTVDLGIYDPHGCEFLGTGFRGASGSARTSFFVGEREATPGYLAGPIDPGRWYLHLGLYKIGPRGCDYEVDIAISESSSPVGSPLETSPSGPLPASTPPAPYAPWLQGELHCHSVHSDGRFSAADLVDLARAEGLDFLAVADHNTISQNRELAGIAEPGLILIRAIEASAYRAHFCVWGISDWVEYRATNAEELAACLQYARQRGGLLSCNHPKPLGPAWDFPQVTSFDCLEVWNGPWPNRNQASLDRWLALLAEGRHITAVAGSDFHGPAQLTAERRRAPGTPTTWVYVPSAPSEAAILDAIRRGHVSLSSRPAGPLVELTAGSEGLVRTGDTTTADPDGRLLVNIRVVQGGGLSLQLLDQRGALQSQMIESVEAELSLRLDVQESLYVRSELRTPDGEMMALTNPIYLARQACH